MTKKPQNKEMEECNCEEMSCSDSEDCERNHTHKTFWCKKCHPEAYDNEHINYVDSRTPEERANEPEGVTTVSNNTTPKAGQAKEWENWEQEIQTIAHQVLDFNDEHESVISLFEARHFVRNLLTQTLQNQRESIIKDIEEMKAGMDEKHICRFNDGEQVCDCYLEAITDILNSLTENNE